MIEICDWCGTEFDVSEEGGYVEGLPCCDFCTEEAEEEMGEELEEAA